MLFLYTFITVPSAIASPYTLDTSVYVTSDYMFRGISQTSNNPAFQVGIDGTHTSGFTAGLFTSNVDFGSISNREFDIYMGYGHDFENDISLDLAAWQYTYNNESSFNYQEYMIGLGYKLADMQIWYTGDYSGTGGEQYYAETGLNIPLNNDFNLSLRVGRTDFDRQIGVGDYSNYLIGVTRQYLGCTVSLLSTMTTNDRFGKNDAPRVLASISKSFNLF